MGFFNKNLLGKFFPKHIDLFEQINNNVLFQTCIKSKASNCVSVSIKSKSDYFEFINKEIIKNQPIDYLEFGVYEGGTITDWPKINTNKNSRFFAFDKFPPKYPIPKIDDERVHFIKGLFQETLPNFVKDFKLQSKLVIFINLNKKFDTLYCLSELDKIFNEKCIIMFDQFGNLQQEFIAFHNYFKSYNRDFQFVCQSENWRKCTVELYPRNKLHTASKKLESYEPDVEKLNNKKKANVIFLLIDNLRLDKFYGKNRTVHTPNIDLLIKKSIFFNSAISSADGTFASMGSIFTSQYPSTTGITWANNHSKARKFFENIKLGGYELHATFPTGPGYDFFETISKSFKNENCDFVDWKNGLFDGIDEVIQTHLTSKKMKSPWFYYIHLMDMHLQRSIHPKFESNLYGKTFYERKLALIDFWLGEFFKLIDLNNTMLILTSDHGDYVLDNELRPDFVPILQQNSQIKKNKIFNSFLETFGNSTIPVYLDEWGRPITISHIGLKIMRTILIPYRQQKFRRTFDEYQIRSTYKRGKNYLFDEAIRIPLLFIGAGIEHSGIFNDLVRHVDIFPTLAHLMNVPINQKNIDGRNLLDIVNRKSENEIPAIIESMPILKKPVGDVIGVRTSKYKYFRSRINPKLDVSLFDLVNDPKEIKNIASSKPDIIIDMERILTNISKNIPDVKEKITNDKKKLALKTLKEMGYD